MSNIKIYPYIVDSPETLLKPSAASSSPEIAEAKARTFQEIFANATRTQQAMAVDALIADSETGSVDPETVQRLLGFNPAPNAIVANAKTTYADSWHNADSTTAASDGTSSNTKTTSPSARQSGHVPNTTKVSSEYMDACFEEAAQTYGLDIDLLKAVAQTESDFDPNCTSSAGAMGVMQLMPGTAADLGVTNAYDVHDNILGGAKYISQLMDKYDGDLSLTLAAYNAGSGTVRKYGGVPPFTERYIQKVMNYYHN